MTEGILSHVVRESGGTDAKIVVVPTASSIPIEVGENYLKAFDKLGCKNVRLLDIRSRVHSDQQQMLQWVEQADFDTLNHGHAALRTDNALHATE